MMKATGEPGMSIDPTLTDFLVTTPPWAADTLALSRSRLAMMSWLLLLVKASVMPCLSASLMTFWAKRSWALAQSALLLS